MQDATIGEPYPIEDFAKDPEHPTDKEIQAMNDYNRIFPKAYEDLTFEGYFGYPDPREPRQEGQDDQRRPDDRAGA